MRVVFAGCLCFMIGGFINGLRAQPQGDFCGQPELHDKLMMTDSAYLERYERAEEVIHQNVLAIKQQRQAYEQYQQNTNCPSGPDMYTVPIVFHIVHNNGAANISDTRVVDAVDNLNKAFRNQGYYDPAKGVDVQLEFCLAKRDTNGNQTNGITRTVSSQYTDLNKSTEDTSLKNLVRWDSEQYINIWVVDTICSGGGSCGTAGYATLAANHGESDDGIVVEDDWINDVEEDVTVLIHEMGHYFDLLHPFKGGCKNDNCLQDGDKICDTPPDDAQYQVFPCSDSINSCSTDTVAPNSPFTTDVPDNHELYMDYSFNQCQNQFSQGQKDRMIAALTGVRESLLESNGCVPVTSRDAALVTIDHPVNNVCYSSFQPRVTLKNVGTNTLTSADIHFAIDQGQQNTYNWNGSLSTNSTTIVSLPNVNVAQGSHNFTAIVSNANGSGNPDGYEANDTLCTSFNFHAAKDTICQNFDNSSGLPSKWSVDNPTNDYTWRDTTLGCSNTATSLYLDAFGKSVRNDTFYDKLILPVLDLSNYSSAQLTFDYAYKRTYSNRASILEVYASENCGFQNDTLFSKSGFNLATTSGISTSEWAPTSCSEWRTETIDLTPYVGGNMQVSFANIIPSYYGQNIYIDNICLQGTPACNTSIDLGPDTSVCNTSYTLDAGSGYDSYQWSTGDNTQTISVSNSSSVQYSVTVTDGNCTASDTAHVQVSPPVQVQLDNIINPNCNGGEGTINISTSNTSPTFSYNWSNGDTTQNLTDASAGPYQVTVMNNYGCADTANYSIMEPKPLQVFVDSVDNVSCNGTCDGQASVSVTGGVQPYLYNWSGGNNPNNSMNNGLCAGSYSVTVTDDNGCDTTLSVTITEPPHLTSTITDTIHASCFGACDGFAVVTPSGGTAPYSYNWSGGFTMNDSIATGLCAGLYSVTVTDSNGCETTDSVNITEPPQLTSSFTDTTQVSCYDECDGAVTVTPLGGTPPYTYNWNGGNTPSDSTNTSLCAGVYSVTITDANQCQQVDSIVITQPDSLDLQLTSTDPTCYNSIDGSASANASGGTPPYDYSWSTGNSSQSVTGIGSGVYGVTVSDANQCIATDSVTLQNPDSLALQASVTDVACGGGSNGAINLTVTGSTSPYAYAWSNGDTTEDISGLTAGSYAVTVASADGCQESGQWMVQQSGQLGVSLDTVINVSCYNGQDGEVQVQVTGGATPYDFQWSNQADTQNLTGVSVGSYTLTVTDDSGCTSSVTAQVTQPDSLVIDSTTSVKDVTCYGDCNGEVALDVSGGTQPYAYNWSNNANDSTITSLCAAPYTVTVVDANGCQVQQSFSITEPDSLDVSINSSDITCYGEEDGQASVSVTGGIAPYSYNWSNGSINDTIDSLGVGQYTVTVTDSNQCSKTASVTIQQPDSLALTFSTYHTECDTATGRVAADVTGGNGSYVFNWSSGETLDSIAGKTAGNYALTITDSIGCTIRDTARVQAIGAPTIAGKESKPVSCFDGQDGEATVIVNGGEPPYSFNWSGGQTDSVATGLSAGTNTVTVTDDSSCSTVATVQVGKPAPISVQPLADTLTCQGASDGIIGVVATGGASSYKYQWNTGDTLPIVNDLPQGMYKVTVTDTNNCTQTDSVRVYAPIEPLRIDSIIANDPSCYQGSDGSIGVVAGPASQAISYSFNGGSTFTSDSQQTSLSAGTHPVIVQNQKGCTAKDTATLENPAPISVDLGSDTSGCDQVTLQAQGPTGSYNWNTGDNGQTIVAQNDGSYSVTVTDNDGCTASDSVDVTIHSAPVVALADTTACDSVELAVASGYQSYTWSNGDQGATTTVSTSGTYWVEVENAEGCSGADTSQVTVEKSPKAGFEVTSNGLTVSLTDTSIAGQTYWWDLGNDSTTTGSVAQYTYDSAGTYTITQVVENNCGSDTMRDTVNVIGTDIDQRPPLSKVKVYPNPNSGQITIDMGQQVQKVSIRAVNVIGQTVHQETWGSVDNSKILHLPDKMHGVYWLHIVTNNSTITKKVVCLDE